MPDAGRGGSVAVACVLLGLVTMIVGLPLLSIVALPVWLRARGFIALGLLGVSINGTELVEGAPVTVSGEEAPEVEVEVQNQGGSTENGVSISVSVDGANTLGTIETLAAGEISSASIPLTPAPKGEVTLDVQVEPVPGEQLTENNEASFSVSFE